MSSPDPDPDSEQKDKAMTRRHLRILVAALATVTLLLGVAAAAARSPRWRRPPPPRVPAFSLSLEDGAGRALSTFHHQGQTWVLGEEGERYVVVVRNPTAERVEAVVSVDGRDVLSGQSADFRRHRGYIVPAFGSVRIEGFRQSLDDVATFRFTNPENSYSSRMGTPENVGVVGVAIFRERVREQAFIPEDEGRFDRFERRRPAPPRKSAAPSAGSAGRARDRAAESDSNIGTEYGESRTSRVVQVSFERASSTPARVLTLRYDDADGLEARGIDVFRRFRPAPRPPRPFPQPFAQGGFAPPPP